MNILIVDDNANNRLIVRMLLEDYEDDNEISFDISDASDGLEAVSICNSKHFDIVLMDIMMPNMNGIEATKIIRGEHPSIMIIAVSAVDDNTRQKLILNSGAEDYISKPINSDIFISRIKNYIKLINVRNSASHDIKVNPSCINVITDKIYHRHTAFIIDGEDSLSEFWELLLLNAETKYDNLSDIVRTMVSIAECNIKISTDCVIYVEESDDYQYFTLDQIGGLPIKVIEIIIKKNKLISEYKIKDDKISFELCKSVTEEEIEVIEEIDTSVNDAPPIEEISKPVEITSSKALVVFNYLEDDDYNDLEEYVAKLSSLMLIAGSDDITSDEIEEIYTYLEKIGSILGTYMEVSDISTALTMLSYELANHIEAFMSNAQALGPMCKAFSADLSSWFKMSFQTGAPSEDFMNDTISVNCTTIASMLKMDDHNESSEEELDDIFDF
ncbi:response regulator [Sulfurimonas sp.]|nr:response regulator [Sulfurimonas sp.]